MHKLKRFVLEKKALLIRASAIVLPLLAIALLLSRPAFAQTTYVITDGSRVLVHTTSVTNPKAVLDEAGLTLGADDTYTIQANDGVVEYNVHRSQTILIDYYGEELEVTSSGETVEELLTRLNLSWGEADTISLPLDADTYDGMELAVAKVVKEEQTYTTVLAHETVFCNDPQLTAETEKVLTEGVDGEVTCTATVTYVNGVETERTVLNQTVTKQPVDEIIAVGSALEEVEETEAEALPVIGDGIITLATGEVLTYTNVIRSYATAYCDKGLTATGTQARVGAIAVDPTVIPYGTRMFIVSEDGQYIYGVATAEDCGSREYIYGTRIDLHYDTLAECNTFGARYCQVYVLG